MQARLIHRLSVGVLFLTATLANAGYIATGPIEGQTCKGLGIEICSVKRLDAVKGGDGKLHTVRTAYDKVDEYNERTGRCFIRTKSVGGGLFSLGLNLVKQPTFYTVEGGSYKELDVEYLTFKCSRVR